MPFLVVMYKGKRISVKVDETDFLIGRAEDAHLILPEHYVSRHHACISFKTGGYRVQDLDSRNGTRLNHQPLTGEPRPLQPEDVISIGTIDMRFVDSLDTLDSQNTPGPTGEIPAGEVFICHATGDDDFVNALTAALLQQGPIDCWVDHNCIEPGQDWDVEIEKALTDTAALIVVLSKKSVASSNVRAEWNYYLDLRKPIFPVQIEPCEIPYRLRVYQILDFQHGIDAALPELLEAIEEVLHSSQE